MAVHARNANCFYRAVIVIGVMLCAGCGEDEQAAQPTVQQPVVQVRTGNGRKVVILGFDGVEPSIVQPMLEQGLLPNLAKLAKRGGYNKLGTTQPPQSPVAWSSFATCRDPAEHGVFGFISRNPKTYRPQSAAGWTLRPKFAQDGSLQSPPKHVSTRIGRTFWAVADEQGIRTKVLSVPFVVPPDTLKHGKMLSGLGIRDISGSFSRFFSMSEDYRQINRFSGGLRLPLRFANDVAKINISGYAAPAQKRAAADGGQRGYLQMELSISVDRAKRQVELEFDGTFLKLNEGKWSEWVESTWEVTDKFKVHAISRFYLLQAGSTVNLYMSCLQYHPQHPYAPLTTPPDYATELVSRYGLYKTIGWVYDTHAVRFAALPEQAFIDDMKTTMAWRERLTLDELDRGNVDLLISVWTATDRAAHLFWRFRDKQHPLYNLKGARQFGTAIEDTYRRMDAIVGKVAQRLTDDDLLMVISDHGFATFRMEFNVNRWLVQQGYATLKGQQDIATAEGKLGNLRDFNWQRTQAYSVGLSGIYLNLAERERNGIVKPEDAAALIARIKRGLLAVTDPKSGEKVFAAIYTPDHSQGAGAKRAPDLLLGFSKGYQIPKAAVTGGIPPELFTPCIDRWSGEHAGNDHLDVPGILFSSHRIANVQPHIIDIGHTALDYLEASAPPKFEGKSLLP
jgi:predicted AlkP superfamily phosphohydrolase/phosphomutase